MSPVREEKRAHCALGTGGLNPSLPDSCMELQRIQDLKSKPGLPDCYEGAYVRKGGTYFIQQIFSLSYAFQYLY